MYLYINFIADLAKKYNIWNEFTTGTYKLR